MTVSITRLEHTPADLAAAPPQIVEKATIVRAQEGAMQKLKEGTNGWTCMAPAGSDPMCMDPNAMEWGHAWQTHLRRPIRLVSYTCWPAIQAGAIQIPMRKGSRHPAITGSGQVRT